jgi:hypothetical protein
MASKKSLLVALGLSLTFAGCSTLAKRNDSGVVVARRAQIRSSTAVVAADLLEVKRGEAVDIIDSVDVPDPTDNTKKERWFRVRAHNDETTEGWIEARNVMAQDVLEKTTKLAQEDKGIPSQATGQLHAGSNLRLTPDRSGNDNIVMRLDSGSSFEIVGWKRVPKAKGTESSESDTAPKAGSATANRNKSSQGDEESPEEQETTELWYKVRLPPDISPGPAGWIYGKQVELSVPSDIIFYRTGREFVAWQRLDGDSVDKDTAPKGKDAAREARPGSWVILEKSSSDQPHTLDEPDFDRIYVLGYDKRDQEHYTAYRSPDLKGFLPMRVEGKGENKTFIVRAQDENGQIKDMQYGISRDARGYLKINAPSTPAAKEKKHK